MKYNLLGNTGVLLSEICLGTMTFGGQGIWEAIGKLPQEEVNKLVKTSIDQGINFIDTANVYSEGLAETLLGNALKQLGINRQEVFIATKVRGRIGAGANQTGLSRLHITDSVNDSLQRLGMDHVDMLYIHGVDPLTSLEETMRGLEDVVRAGKARYNVHSVIIGAKREEQLKDNIAATGLTLTEEDIQMLDEISALPEEYPGWMVDRQMRNRYPE